MGVIRWALYTIMRVEFSKRSVGASTVGIGQLDIPAITFYKYWIG